MTAMKRISMPPVVRLVGEVEHPDFRETVGLIRAQSRPLTAMDESPDVMIVVQSRPGSVNPRIVETFRRTAPLAGVAAVVGSWCEGETRTGRPSPGVKRLYWYEFPGWWNRQLALRAAGKCPDWARPDGLPAQASNAQASERDANDCPPRRGLVSLYVAARETADAIAVVLQRAGFATAWQPHGASTPTIRGAIAGIWDGGQLNERESDDLSNYCRRLAAEGAPVVALLDFPRRDRVDRAVEIGVAAVLGKPWFNNELVERLQSLTEQRELVRAA
jgi:hypothetical protein